MSTPRNASAREQPWQIDRWVWQWCNAKETLLGLLLLIAAALALSYAFPQIPAHLRSDPVGYQEWLSATQVRFKNWTPFLETLGAFYVQDTLWFRILLAILAFILLVSLGSQIDSLLRPVPIRQPDAFYGDPDTVSFSGSLPQAQVFEAVQRAMNALLRRVQKEMNGGKTYLYGSRAIWATASTAIVYLSLLLIAGGLIINSQWGWQQTHVQLLPDEPVLIGPDGRHKIQLVNVQAAPTEIEIQVGENQRISVRWGSPTHHRGFRYQQVNRGSPFVQIRARRDTGETLTLYDYTVRPSPVDSLSFAFSSATPREEADRLFIVSEERIVGRLKWLNSDVPASGEQPRLHLWVFGEDGQTLIGEQEISANGSTAAATIGDVTYVLDIARYVVMDIAYQPGLWVLRTGSAFLVAGLLGSIVPRRQMWSVIIPQDDSVAVKIREQSQGLFDGLRRKRDRILAQLRADIQSTQDVELSHPPQIEEA